jgi:hypothetical protein
VTAPRLHDHRVRSDSGSSNGPHQTTPVGSLPFAVQRDAEIGTLPQFPQELLDLAVYLAILRLDACVLAAQMTRVIALMALAGLGSSEGSFHEPFHAHGPYLGNPATVRNIGDGARSAQNDDRVIEQFDAYFGLESLPIAHDDNDMPKYPPGYHHFNLAGTELLKQARRGDADLRASGRVIRRSSPSQG